MNTERTPLTDLLDKRRISYRVQQIEPRKVVTGTTVSTRQKVVVILGMIAVLILFGIFVLLSVRQDFTF